MGKDCCELEIDSKTSERFKKALWVALYLNAAMFVVEIVFSILARSTSLQADSVDFLGDALNYSVTLFVLSRGHKARATASLLKGSSMALFGVAVLTIGVFRLASGYEPHAETMGLIGFVALLVNLSVAVMLYKFRDGDSNMQSVWLCSRNDSIGNLAVILAAVGVHYFVSPWPDFVVATLMAGLGLHSAYLIFRKVRDELKSHRTHSVP